MRVIGRWCVELLFPFFLGFAASLATFPPDCATDEPSAEVAKS